LDISFSGSLFRRSFCGFGDFGRFKKCHVFATHFNEESAREEISAVLNTLLAVETAEVVDTVHAMMATVLAAVVLTTEARLAETALVVFAMPSNVVSATVELVADSAM